MRENDTVPTAVFPSCSCMVTYPFQHSSHTLKITFHLYLHSHNLMRQDFLIEYPTHLSIIFSMGTISTYVCTMHMQFPAQSRIFSEDLDHYVSLGGTSAINCTLTTQLRNTLKRHWLKTPPPITATHIAFLLHTYVLEKCHGVGTFSKPA